MNGTEGSDHHYLEWVRSKHGYQGAEFVDALVKACAQEFSTQAVLSEDQRAEIYDRVRESIEQSYEACLRKHARISCCS